eukprot:gene36758-41611_t
MHLRASVRFAGPGQHQLEQTMGMMPNPDVALDEKAIIVEAEKALADIATIRQEVAKVIFGQEKVVENTLLAILSGGHALLVGVPGLAKTKLVTTLGTVL